MTSVDSAINLTMTFLALLHFVPFASRHAGRSWEHFTRDCSAYTVSVLCIIL